MLKFSQNLGCANFTGFFTGYFTYFSQHFHPIVIMCIYIHISVTIKQFKVQVSSYFFSTSCLISSLYFKEEVMPCVEHSPCNREALSSNPTLTAIASHAGVFRGACFSSLLTNACSTKDNFPFLSLANHNVLSKIWKVDLDRRVI